LLLLLYYKSQAPAQLHTRGRQRGNRKLSLETAHFPSQISRGQKTTKAPSHKLLQLPLTWATARKVICTLVENEIVAAVWMISVFNSNLPGEVVKSGNENGSRRTRISRQAG